MARGSQSSVLENDAGALPEAESTSSGPDNGVAVPESSSTRSVPDDNVVLQESESTSSVPDNVVLPESESACLVPASNVTRPESENTRSVIDNGVARPETESARSSKSPPNSGRSDEISSVLGTTELLDCSVCCTTMYPRINQCPNGHTLCSSCKNKVSKCPNCRTELGSIQCLALDEFEEFFFKLPCTYQSNGCKESFPYNSKANSKVKHEESCRFRPYSCGHANRCPVTGDIPRIMAHLRDGENAYVVNMCAFSNVYSDPAVTIPWKLVLVNCFARNFCMHLERFQQGDSHSYLCFIRFMGEDDDASKFRYSLEVGPQGQKLTWQGIPRSIRDTAKVRESLDGLIIRHGFALFCTSKFREGRGMRVRWRIWQVKK